MATLAVLASVGLDQRFLGVISAVLVLDPSRDATIGNAVQRIVATLIGTAVGGAGLLLAPTGPMLSMLMVMLLMGAIAAIRPQWRYGLVAAAGIAIGSADGDLLQISLDRTAAIFIGATIGIIAGLLIWPKSSQAYARQHLKDALEACNALLEHSIAQAVAGDDPDLSKLHQTFRLKIERASEAAASVRLSKGNTKRHLVEAVHRTERLWHALIILDRIGETKSEGAIVDEDQGRKVRELKAQCCKALSALQRLEPVEPACLERIEQSGRALDIASAKADAPDRIERLGLAYGLREIVRNLGDLNHLLRQEGRQAPA